MTDQLILYHQGKCVIVWFVISCGRLNDLYSYDRPVDIEPTGRLLSCDLSDDIVIGLKSHVIVMTSWYWSYSINIDTFVYIQALIDFICLINRISGVMISLYAWGAVDCGFKPRSGQTKDYIIGMCCFSSKHIKEKEQRLVGVESE